MIKKYKINPDRPNIVHTDATETQTIYYPILWPDTLKYGQRLSLDNFSRQGIPQLNMSTPNDLLNNSVHNNS